MSWTNRPRMAKYHSKSSEESEEFSELIRFTFAGFAGGAIAAFLLETLGFQRSAVGQWLVRTLSGEGESIFEGLYVFRQRWLGKAKSMAEAYGWGKFIGIFVPWIYGLGNSPFGDGCLWGGKFLYPLRLRDD